MIFGEKEMQRVEQLKHHELLLFQVIEYIECKFDIGYFETLDMFRKIGFTEDDLEYFGIRDYDTEEELLGDE